MCGRHLHAGCRRQIPDKGTYGEHSACSLLRIKPVFERRTFVSSALECIIKGNCIFVNPKFAEKCIKVHVFLAELREFSAKVVRSGFSWCLPLLLLPKEAGEDQP